MVLHKCAPQRAGVSWCAAFVCLGYRCADSKYLANVKPAQSAAVEPGNLFCNLTENQAEHVPLSSAKWFSQQAS